MAHKEQSQLLEELTQAKERVDVGGKYSHYKHSDQFYTILAVGFIESTEEPCVVYKAEYGEKLVWVRTLKDFTAKVSLEGGKQVDRFTKVV